MHHNVAHVVARQQNQYVLHEWLDSLKQRRQDSVEGSRQPPHGDVGAVEKLLRTGQDQPSTAHGREQRSRDVHEWKVIAEFDLTRKSIFWHIL